MVPNTTPDNAAFPSIVFGSAGESLGPSGRDSVPDASGALDFGNPAGASPRPATHDSAMGQAAQAGDAQFHESSIAPQTLPEKYNAITDRGTFRG